MNQSARTNSNFPCSIKAVLLHATVTALVVATTFVYANITLAQGKRGLGGNNNPVITGINSNWYYRWGLGINNDISHAEFVPMFWGEAM
jgi:hypothetical protein